MEICIFFNESGAARAPNLTAQTMKLHGIPRIFNDSGATTKTMKMCGNLNISIHSVPAWGPVRVLSPTGRVVACRAPAQKSLIYLVKLCFA